ncbi:hypothetical protein TrVGV298_002991 [Trichoderma virens]|nr:hypothetical protein TrVGV298_002991 [Trichoderma virens]
MSNRPNNRLLPAAESGPERPRPIEQLHPVLLSVVDLSLAISMLPDDEQSYIVSRIMTDDEIAEERLQSPQVQDLRRPVRLSGDEIRLLLRGSPGPEDDTEEGEVQDGCIVCFAQSDVSVPCGCHYCGRCLRENIRVGLRSEVDFPPGCCRPFDEATIRLAGRPALVHLFSQLSAEYAVPAGERLYCHDPGCSSFIQPRAIQPAALDEDDATPVGTCLPCREDEDEEALWDMMDDQGLVGCPECGVVIALKEGCNHMTCVCTAQFCYLCGLDWEQQCSCPQYNGFHLRVPVRQRPGRRPIRRGGRAHLAGGAGGMTRIPQLRYDPDDEVALAAVDFAPIGIPAPAAALNQVPDREPEPIIRHNAAEDMEIPLHRNAPRRPQLRHHVPAVRPNLFNGGPVDLMPFPPLPLFPEEFPPIPGAFPSDLPPHFLPHFHPLDRPLDHDNPAPNHPPNRPFNNWPLEVPRQVDVMPDELEQAIQRLRIVEAVLQDQHSANVRREAAIIEEIARETQRTEEIKVSNAMNQLDHPEDAEELTWGDINRIKKQSDGEE